MYNYFYYRQCGADMHQLVTTEGHKVLSSLADLDLLKAKYFKLKDAYDEDIEALAIDLKGLRGVSPASYEQGEQYLAEHKDCHKILKEWDREWQEKRSREVFKVKFKRRKHHKH